MTSLGGVAAVAVAGLAAGTINTVVGSGTLITFPVLLSLGVPPVTANVSNTIGLVPGGFSGVYGYRRELAGQRDRLRRLGLASLLGGVFGASLLLVLPAGVFKAVVPILIVLALVLVVAQPRLSRRYVGADQAGTAEGATGRHPVLLWVLVLLTGVYGGYFGAAQGVLLVAMLGALLDSNLQRVNAVKNVLSLLVNLIAAVLFIVLAHPNWTYAAIIAVSSAFGGQLGAVVGRRLPAPALRAVIVVVGLAALIKFLLF
ncbi:MAG: sulfite exporter TauE/SafE family protein [Jatrophihabitantaceae bacterium]